MRPTIWSTLLAPACFVTAIFLLPLAGCKDDAGDEHADEIHAEPIGTAECAACGMVVREQPAPRAQLVHRDGTRQYFCALSDLIHYAETPSPHGQINEVFVETLDPQADPEQVGVDPRPWLDAEEAHFVVGMDRPGIMGAPALTYASREDAEAVAERLDARLIGWDELDEHLIGAAANMPDRQMPGRQVVVSRQAIKMGTNFEIKVVAGDEARADAAIDAAFAEIDRVEALLSEWRDDSEISRVNQKAGSGPVEVGPELVEVVERAQQISKMTDGAFDITFAGCADLWSVSDERIPSDEAIADCKPRIDYRKVDVDPDAQTIALEDEHTRIGIAAIGKGYGVDRAAEVLIERGVENFMIEGGGDIRARGSHPKRPWKVGIAHPRERGEVLTTLPVTDAAVVSSGDYEHYFERDGKRYHHIIDPTTARPARESVAVTVVAPNATDADALATAFFVVGPERALAIAGDLPGVEALIVGPDLQVHTTEGISSP